MNRKCAERRRQLPLAGAAAGLSGRSGRGSGSTAKSIYRFASSGEMISLRRPSLEKCSAAKRTHECRPRGPEQYRKLGYPERRQTVPLPERAVHELASIAQVAA